MSLCLERFDFILFVFGLLFFSVPSSFFLLLVVQQLIAAKNGEAVSEEDASPNPMYKMLGYFSLVGLLRLHVLLGIATDILSVVSSSSFFVYLWSFVRIGKAMTWCFLCLVVEETIAIASS